MFNKLNKELHQDLIDFCEKERNNKQPKKFNYALVSEIFRQIIDGDREITSIATNRKNGDVFIKLSFTKDTEEVKL